MIDFEAILAVEKNEMASSEFEEVRDLLKEQQETVCLSRSA